ncbi:MAG: hypothetical protein M1818_003927 [Claussenomyces sp. TS43310]|nr:MAG: hypothetical protein M1818_003927 [Claussenomyces sp. TS43310]
MNVSFWTQWSRNQAYDSGESRRSPRDRSPARNSSRDGRYNPPYARDYGSPQRSNSRPRIVSDFPNNRDNFRESSNRDSSRDFSNRDPPRAPKALLDTREPNLRDPPSGPRATSFSSDFRGGRTRGRGRGWYDDVRDRGRDLDRDYRDRRDDRPSQFREDRGRERDWFERDRRDRESFRGRRPPSPGRGRGRGRGDYDYYGRGRGYDDRSRFRGRSRSPEMPQTQRPRRQSLAVASPPPPVVPAFGTVPNRVPVADVPKAVPDTAAIPKGPRLMVGKSGKFTTSRNLANEPRVARKQKKQPQKGAVMQHLPESGHRKSKAHLTHVFSDDDEVDSEDELDDEYFQEEVLAVQARIAKDAYVARPHGLSMISSEEVKLAEAFRERSGDGLGVKESDDVGPELGKSDTVEKDHVTNAPYMTSNSTATAVEPIHAARIVSAGLMEKSITSEKPAAETSSQPVPSVEQATYAIASKRLGSASPEEHPVNERSASTTSVLEKSLAIPADIQAPQPLRKPRMVMSVPPPSDDEGEETEAEYREQLNAIRPLLKTMTLAEQIAAVRPQIKTPPKSSLLFASDSPSQTAWDDNWAMSRDLSHEFKQKLRDDVVKGLQETHHEEEKRQKELALEYKRRYKVYLLLHRHSQEPWVVRYRDEWASNRAANATPATNAPTAVEARLEGRRTASRFATEHDIARVLKESEREAREEAERTNRAAQAKAASEKEAAIPDMLSRQDRETSRFPDRSGLVPSDRCVAFFQVLPPIDNFDEEESEIFLQTMLEYPKQWTKIAAALPNRDYKACIQHYYLVKHELGLKGLLGKPRKGRKKGRTPAKPKSNALMKNFKPGDTETEDGQDNMETVGERRRPRRAAAPTFTSERAPSESENNTPAPKPERRGGTTAKKEFGPEGAPVKRRARNGTAAREKVPKPPKSSQPPVIGPRSASKGREDDRNPMIPRPGPVPGIRGPSSAGYYQPHLWDDISLMGPTSMAPHMAASYAATAAAAEPVPSYTIPTSFPPSLPPSFPPSAPSSFAASQSVQNNGPTATTTVVDVIQQPYAPDRMSSVPPSAPHDNPQQKSRNFSQTSSYWSVPDQSDFPALLAHFGTDWAGIAKWMGTKTHIMVYTTIFQDWFTLPSCKTERGSMTNIKNQVKNYYQRQVDQGRSDLQDIARRADEKKARGESTGQPPVPTVPIKRKYDGPSSSLQRSLGSVMDSTEDVLSAGQSTLMPQRPSSPPPQASRFSSGAQVSPAPQAGAQPSLPSSILPKQRPQSQQSPHIQQQQHPQQAQQPSHPQHTQLAQQPQQPQQPQQTRSRGPALGYFNPDRDRPILQASSAPQTPPMPLTDPLRSQRSLMVAQEAQMEKEQAQRLEQQQQARQLRMKQEAEMQNSSQYEHYPAQMQQQSTMTASRNDSTYRPSPRSVQSVRTPVSVQETARSPVQAQPTPAVAAVRQQETVRKTSSIMSLLNDEPSEPRVSQPKTAAPPVQPAASPAQQQQVYQPPTPRPATSSTPTQYQTQHQLQPQAAGPSRGYTPMGYPEPQPTPLRRQVLQQHQTQPQTSEISSPYQQPISQQQQQQPMYQQPTRAQPAPIRRDSSLGEMHSPRPYQPPPSAAQGSMRLVESPYSSMPPSQPQQVRQQDPGPASEREYHQPYLHQHQQSSHRPYAFGQSQASHQTASPTSQAYGFNFSQTSAASGARHGSFDGRQGLPVSATPPLQQPGYPAPSSQQQQQPPPPPPPPPRQPHHHQHHSHQHHQHHPPRGSMDGRW